ncbi:xylulokinase [uncultured Sulfitobacter sp.]|uniref:xylulokinase n=1 Tax=uncultured Sulfitobacter sp. TaxID=191468 RepID=UPI002614FF1A|nr:xylulokinase [uncultured Sulfitobacter sp.]
MSYLGVDIGTSGLRALLVTDEATVIGSSEQSYPTQHPHTGWSEQDPADWIAAFDAAVDSLRTAHPEFRKLKGIGVAGHMHGATLLDANDDVLRPCILWNDTRAHAEAAALDANPDFRTLSGNIVFPGFTAPKLEWLRTHEPEVFQRIAKVLLPAGYLNHHLTGNAVADVSDSAGTSWLDVGQRDWSDTLLAATRMQKGQMPRLVEGCAAAGLLRDELAQKWGLNGDVVIAGGAGDNAAAACGLGLIQEGQGFVSLGTSGVVLLTRDTYQPAASAAVHSFCHAVPERWYQMGVMLAATDSLNWLATITGKSAQVLTQVLGDTIMPPCPTRFFPYLSGERTPHNDAHIRAGFVGIGSQTSRTDLTRAVLEGICFGLRDCFEAVCGTAAKPAYLFAIGGGSASRYWLRLLATILNTPLHIPAQGENGAALGAARLAMVAATGKPVDRVMGTVETAEIIAPVTELVGAFDAAYQTFRESYPILKSQTQTGAQ